MNTRKTTKFGIFEERPLTIQEASSQLREVASPNRELTLLVWRPSPEIADGYPGGLSIAFEVLRDETGSRRFVPHGDPGAFISYSWLAGLAILRWSSHMSPAECFSYRFFKLVFDRVNASREHLGRSFSAARDLFVRPKGRGGAIGKSLLPDYVGLTASGEGSAWSNSELTRRGREAAIDDGVENPTNDKAIWYGLALAAEMNPLFEHDPGKIRALVMMSLFDAGDSPQTATEAELEDVIHRLSAAIEAHEDDAWELFEGWFAGRKNNLIKSLARKAGYSVLSRAVVKAALLEIGMRSYQYVGDCLGAFAKAMRQGLAESLNDAENRQFEAMYMPQPAYGGLPLFLLSDRFDQIHVIVKLLWDRPDDEHLIGALHRLLAIYAALAPARREADRRFKKRRPKPPIAANSPASLCGNTVETPFKELLPFARRLVEENFGKGCPKCRSSAGWKVTMKLLGKSDVRATIVCKKHGFEQSCDLSSGDLADVAKNLS